MDESTVIGQSLARGFRINRIDRALDEHTIIGQQEPQVALSGLDKISVRKLLGDRGFQYVIDAGLGSNASDFDRFRINTFDRNLQPSARPADRWAYTSRQRPQLIFSIVCKRWPCADMR